MTRIIAGSARGRRLAVPTGDGTRPTSDRAREGLFGTLESLHGHLSGARVLDLYAGTGAVGLEALSRGAAHATLVESDDRALATLRANVTATGLANAHVVGGSVLRFLRRERDGQPPYDIVFADPPYALDEADLVTVLASLTTHEWLAAGAVVAVERGSKSPAPMWPAGYEAVRERRYGDGTIHYAVVRQED